MVRGFCIGARLLLCIHCDVDLSMHQAPGIFLANNDASVYGRFIEVAIIRKLAHCQACEFVCDDCRGSFESHHNSANTVVC